MRTLFTVTTDPPAQHGSSSHFLTFLLLSIFYFILSLSFPLSYFPLTPHPHPVCVFLSLSLLCLFLFIHVSDSKPLNHSLSSMLKSLLMRLRQAYVCPSATSKAPHIHLQRRRLSDRSFLSLPPAFLCICSPLFFSFTPPAPTHAQGKGKGGEERERGIRPRTEQNANKSQTKMWVDPPPSKGVAQVNRSKFNNAVSRLKASEGT